MLASLPMYDWPEIRAHTEAFWAAIARRLGVELALSKAGHHDSWQQPDMLFSQCCGYPLTHAYKDVLHYVATPHYEAEGCDGPLYRSILFAREKAPLAAFHGLRGAINGSDSMSGMLALRHSVPGLAVEIVSGSHVNSLAMVQAGDADICAIDAVCVALARVHRPWLLEGLFEVGRSTSVPGLPFVTRAGDVAKLRDALGDVVQDPQLAASRKALLISGFSILPPEAYQQILLMERLIA